MSPTGYTGPTCPICTLPAIKRLGPSVETSAVSTIVLDELDWDVVTTLVPKCDLCKLLVDLREHWKSDKADEQIPHSGITYGRMCENGTWWPPYFPRRTMYNIFVDFDSVTANRVQSYELSGDALSDRSKRQYMHWNEVCRKNHPRCPKGVKKLPTRVIDVQNERLKLLDPSPSDPHSFVALSHCWGTCRDFLTTRENAEERKAGFALEDLPATFRDAVLATRALGIRYLWIDSICILQGDKEDWELEGSRLADIYSDATVTICATNATDDADGFLRPRERPPTADIHIVGPGRATHLYIHSAQINTGGKDYLSERAWCLQERYLSPRILSFEHDATTWECFEAALFETSRQSSSSGPSLFNERDDQQKLRLKWATMVENYSRRALTYNTDTLPALSAVAARAAQASGDQYLAGLWKTDLPRWLLWHGTRYAGGFNRAEHPTRPKTYFAPSWSWASYAGSVMFQAPPAEEKYQMFDTMTITETSVHVPGKNKFGSVASATLSLHSPLLELEIPLRSEIPKEKDWQGYESGILSCPDLDVPEERFQVILDYPREQIEGEIIGIPIFHHGGAIYSRHHVAAGTLQEGASEAVVRNLAFVFGLLARRKATHEDGICERVGIFQIGWIPLDQFLDKITRKQVQEIKLV